MPLLVTQKNRLSLSLEQGLRRLITAERLPSVSFPSCFLQRSGSVATLGLSFRSHSCGPAAFFNLPPESETYQCHNPNCLACVPGHGSSMAFFAVSRSRASTSSWLPTLSLRQRPSPAWFASSRNPSYASCSSGSNCGPHNDLRNANFKAICAELVQRNGKVSTGGCESALPGGSLLDSKPAQRAVADKTVAHGFPACPAASPLSFFLRHRDDNVAASISFVCTQIRCKRWDCQCPSLMTGCQPRRGYPGPSRCFSTRVGRLSRPAPGELHLLCKSCSVRSLSGRVAGRRPCSFSQALGGAVHGIGICPLWKSRCVTDGRPALFNHYGRSHENQNHRITTST